MSTSTERFHYRREKIISIAFEGKTEEFLLRAPSARDNETAMSEAQDIQKGIVKRLKDATETMRDIYLLQELELLQEALVGAEYNQLRQKASRTIAPDTEDCEGKLAEKIELLSEKRRVEIEKIEKEELVDRLVRMELAKQIELAWTHTALSASLAQALHEKKGEKLFHSLEEMKSQLSSDLIEELLEAWVSFLSERGNAQVFLEPCTFNG